MLRAHTRVAGIDDFRLARNELPKRFYVAIIKLVLDIL
jgi:hypothetical protein